MTRATYKQFYFALLLITSGPVLALDSLRWFPNAPYAFAGVDHQLQGTNKGVSVFCRGRGSDTSNMGLGLVLVKNRKVEIVVQWTHHSCITQAHDLNVYDGFGIQARAYFW